MLKFIELLDLDNLSSLENTTYDTLVDWINTGFFRYYDSLQTTIPDLTTFKNAGGKLLHYHGESDPSIPPASSVRYREAVRNAMYPNSTSDEDLQEFDDWYQFYLIPGYAHCGTNSLQPGPSPEKNMEIMIDWVENGNTPTGLNTTVTTGSTYSGEEQLLCKWPSRPLWSSDDSFDCVYDEDSYSSWIYDLNAFKVEVY
ncbi:unnamed protein product [Ambrosiozyma monospora]|uniref:Unnamed protein product n=1 Tax=Ambrosiozyma monospora TaxID=43982 RepID=A0ACB5U9B4_AMBMO|nr:unnamed protein product [Ambrosiozyma monospora]